MLGNRGSSEARSHLCVMPSLLPHDLCHGRSSLRWLPVHFYALGKEMATYSSVPAWRIPGTVEPDGLPSMGSHRVGHNWSDLAAAAAATLMWQKQHCPMLIFLHRYKEIVLLNYAYDKQFKKNIKLIFMIWYTWNLKNNTSELKKQK